MTVGLPRSGKSTWARNQGMPIVEPDSIRLSLHGMPHWPSAEPYVWAIAKTMVEALFYSGHDTVILDSTMMLKAQRDCWKDEKWIREFKIFDTSLEVCIQRVMRDSNTDLVPVIERQAAKFQSLQEDELNEQG